MQKGFDLYPFGKDENPHNLNQADGDSEQILELASRRRQLYQFRLAPPNQTLPDIIKDRRIPNISPLLR